jgi:DNA invertase Pin-like site-specific DNA recombinase
MAKADKAGAILVFSKIGYLSRNLKFLRALAEGGANLKFVALDDQDFTPDTFRLYLAEAKDVWHQRRNLIKERMAKKKKRGAKFGARRPGAQSKNWRAAEPWNAAAQASVAARAARVDAAYAAIIPEMTKMRDKGMSFTEIATALNDAGHLTTSHKPFSAPTVFKIMKRLKRQGGQDAAKGRKGLGSKAHAGAAR